MARQTFCISMDALCTACVAMESGGGGGGGEGIEEDWRCHCCRDPECG